MKFNKFAVLIIVLALFALVTMAGCTTTPPEPPAGEDGEAIAYDPVFVTNVTPKLQEMVDAGDMTQDSADLIIERIKDGTYARPDVQAILAGATPPPVRGEEPAPAPAPAPEPEGDAAYDEAWLANVTPKLQDLVDAEKMTQEKMDEVIAKIKSGEFGPPEVQKIMAEAQ